MVKFSMLNIVIFRAGSNHDHFDHWKWNSNLNQQLLNGRYWKSLKKDGLMDRLTPTNEAYDQQSGKSHDRLCLVILHGSQDICTVLAWCSISSDSKWCRPYIRHPVHDLFVGTWNIGSGYGPASAPHPAVDVFKLADRDLMSNFVGETAVPELDVQDLAPVVKVI